MPEAGKSLLLERWIFHFTHIDNVANIAAAGHLLCDSNARSALRQEVGDPVIKEARRQRVIPVGPGGRVGAYVPFYFSWRSPMMFRIACDHRDRVDGRYPDGDRPLVYFATTVERVVEAGLPWVATDGNAATAMTEFSTDITRLDTMVDWDLMRAELWNSTPDDPDRQRRRMAEFLVAERTPLSIFQWVATYDDAHAARVQELLARHPLGMKVLVRPAWYYGYTRRG